MKNKTVLISGGTYGIGKGIVFQLLHNGYNVATFSRNKKKVDSFKRELKEARVNQSLVLLADVRDEKQIKSVTQRVVKRFSAIDILINNAGVSYFTGVDNVDIKHFNAMLQTNVVGIAVLTKHTVPYMKKQRSGLIINLASISGKHSYALGEFYSATKFGVIGYSEGIRKELKGFGIKVCTVCPGMVKTGFFDKKELARRKKMLGGEIPTMLEIGDISKTMAFICDQADHCDIQDITIMPF